MKYSKLRECMECGEMLEATHPRQTICDPPKKCKEIRNQRLLKEKVARVRSLKDAGSWKEHQRSTLGTGKGGKHKRAEITRVCLKCDLGFKVGPEDKDRICKKCTVDNERLLNEYTEDSLGIATICLSLNVGEGRGY